jgi:uncharacterized protein (TIGR03000 family)
MKLTAFLLGIVGLAACTGHAVGQYGNRAQVVITVPVDARVYFDEVLTTQTGTTRTYSTPALTPGMDYGYTIRAEVVRNGMPAPSALAATAFTAAAGFAAAASAVGGGEDG